MGYPNVARNLIRDFVTGNINEAAVGIDDSPFSLTDTSIGNEVIAKDEGSGDLSESKPTDGKAVYEWTLGLSEANGEDLTEWVLRDTNNSDLYVRVVHSTIPKDNTFELDYKVTLILKNTD